MSATRLALVALVIAGCASQKPAPVTERGKRATTAAKPAPAAPAPVAEGTYVVKKGDTLYSIALEHGADYREVALWNRLDDPTKIATSR